jgi:hypothetical protein
MFPEPQESVGSAIWSRANEDEPKHEGRRNTSRLYGIAWIRYVDLIRADCINGSEALGEV